MNTIFEIVDVVAAAKCWNAIVDSLNNDLLIYCLFALVPRCWWKALSHSFARIHTQSECDTHHKFGESAENTHISNTHGECSYSKLIRSLRESTATMAPPYSHIYWAHTKFLIRQILSHQNTNSATFELRLSFAAGITHFRFVFIFWPNIFTCRISIPSATCVARDWDDYCFRLTALVCDW